MQRSLGICLFLLLILTTKYLFIQELSFYFKSAKVIKLKTLYLSNVKKFYNDLTWPIKFIKHIYMYSQILSYLSIKIDIYNFRIFIRRHFFGGGRKGNNRLYCEMKKKLFLGMTNSKYVQHSKSEVLYLTSMKHFTLL